MDQSQKNSYGHAVVIGASMAGLLATRVLSDHFARVTLVERDQLPHSAEPRKGVPQGRHVHGLLNRGEQILTHLFPDLVPALQTAGAIRVDMGADVNWHHFGVWKTRFLSGVDGLMFSRPLLEWQVGQRVAALPNVRVIDECDVNQFATNDDRTRITGIKIQRRHENTTEEALSADLVVDASGRGSQTPHWLDSLGYQKPEESTVKIGIGYATKIYRRPDNFSAWKALIVTPQPPDVRGGIIFPIEGNRWIVTLIGALGDHPPLDEQGYLEFARSLTRPELHHAIEPTEPLTPITAHKFPMSLRRHYEKLRRFPERLLVLGDALCSFNPVYGQGMTVSALDALALDACLKDQRRRCGADLTGLWRKFQPEVAKVADVPWQLTTGEDLRYPQAEGPRPASLGFLHWYIGKVHEAAGHDQQITHRFYQVMHMLAPPSVLFRPDVMLRLARAAFHTPTTSLTEQVTQ